MVVDTVSLVWDPTQFRVTGRDHSDQYFRSRLSQGFGSAVATSCYLSPLSWGLQSLALFTLYSSFFHPKHLFGMADLALYAPSSSFLYLSCFPSFVVYLNTHYILQQGADRLPSGPGPHPCEITVFVFANQGQVARPPGVAPTPLGRCQPTVLY